MTIKDKKELYTVLWKEARRLYSKYDLCKIKSNKSCLAYRKKYLSTPFCCNYCEYLCSKGCTVQSLSCSFAACFFGQFIFPFTNNKQTIAIQKRVKALYRIAKKYNLPLHGRCSKTKSFRNEQPV